MEHYQRLQVGHCVFLTLDSNSWDTSNEAYKLNEDSHLGSSGRTVTPPDCTHHAYFGAVDVSAVQASSGDNDVDIKSTDKASPKLVSWREDMVAGRKRRKAPHKIQRTLHNINFELAVAEAKLCDLDSDETFLKLNIWRVVISKEIPQHFSYQRVGIIMMTYTQRINSLLSCQQYTWSLRSLCL